MRKRLAFIVASVLILSLFAVAFWTTIDNLGKTINNLEKTVDNLGKRVEALENKSWHPVGDFTLSPSKTSERFNIQGEAWRMSYTFNIASLSGMRIGYNLRAYDADGNIVGGLSGIELSDLRDSGKGVLYIPEGHGDYSVEIRDITGEYTFSFKVESYY